MMRSRKLTGRGPWCTILIDTLLHQRMRKKEHETKFKEVGEAYAILSDEKKRRMYDSGQDLEDGGGCGGFHDVDPNSIFQAFFGGGAGGMGGMGGNMGGHSFQFQGAPGHGQSFSFQFG